MPFFDWLGGDVITAVRLNQPYDVAGNLTLDGSRTVGTAAVPIVSLNVDNAATDGGTIYFDAGATEFIQVNAAGTEMDISDFSTVTIGADATTADFSNAKVIISQANSAATSAQNIGLAVEGNTSGATVGYGLFGVAGVDAAGDTADAFGVYGQALAVHTGVGGENFGGYFAAQNATDANYGVYGNASGASTVNYGVYANATGGTTNYSFYGNAGASYNAGKVATDTSYTVANRFIITRGTLANDTASVDVYTIPLETVNSGYVIVTLTGSDGAGTATRFGRRCFSYSMSGGVIASSVNEFTDGIDDFTIAIDNPNHKITAVTTAIYRCVFTVENHSDAAAV